jgi:hypothetical protein
VKVTLSKVTFREYALSQMMGKPKKFLEASKVNDPKRVVRIFYGYICPPFNEHLLIVRY